MDAAMASKPHVADYVTDQIRGAGQVRSHKMFGEYAIYCNERVVALLCDDQLYVRPTEGGRAFIGEAKEAPPYPGAKPHFQVTDRLDDRDWLTELVVITAKEVPLPKSKKPKKPAVKTKATAKKPRKPRS